jgi:hypothetical protein
MYTLRHQPWSTHSHPRVTLRRLRRTPFASPPWSARGRGYGWRRWSHLKPNPHPHPETRMATHSETQSSTQPSTGAQRRVGLLPCVYAVPWVPLYFCGNLEVTRIWLSCILVCENCVVETRVTPSSFEVPPCAAHRRAHRPWKKQSAPLSSRHMSSAAPLLRALPCTASTALSSQPPAPVEGPEASAPASSPTVLVPLRFHSSRGVRRPRRRAWSRAAAARASTWATPRWDCTSCTPLAYSPKAPGFNPRAYAVVKSCIQSLLLSNATCAATPNQRRA